MCLDILFVIFLIVIYSESLLTRIAGKTISTLLLVTSTLGLCSLIAVFFVEAL
jgi:hypothetical protein